MPEDEPLTGQSRPRQRLRWGTLGVRRAGSRGRRACRRTDAWRLRRERPGSAGRWKGPFSHFVPVANRIYSVSSPPHAFARINNVRKAINNRPNFFKPLALRNRRGQENRRDGLCRTKQVQSGFLAGCPFSSIAGNNQWTSRFLQEFFAERFVVHSLSKQVQDVCAVNWRSSSGEHRCQVPKPSGRNALIEPDNHAADDNNS